MIRAILVAVLAAAAAIPARAADMDLRMIRFYEGGFHPPSKADRRYLSVFPKSSTRFVFWEMNVHNNLYKVRDHSHQVVARWYRSNGSQLGSTTQTFNVRSAWANAWVSHGKGYRQPGRWPPGKYRVDILVDGRLYTRRFFLIYDDAKVDPNDSGFDYTGLRLFESGRRAAPTGQRQYTTTFARSDTRYVYAEVRGRNTRYGQGDQYPILLIRFFRDGNVYVGESILYRTVVRSTWRSALLAGGWGWNEPGHWRAGRYRVEVWMGNDRKLGETNFTVTTATGPPSNDNNDKGPEGLKPNERPQADDRLPEPPKQDTPPKKDTTPPKQDTPPPKAPDKPRDLDELEKL